MPSNASAPLRRLVPAAVAAALALALAGCSGSPSGSATSSAASAAAPSPAASPATSTAACATSGSASQSVKVSGKAGAAPAVKFPLPTAASATQRTVITAGHGNAVQTGSSVKIAYELFEGATGKQLDQSGYTAAKKPVILTADTSQYLPGLVESIVCGKVGERFAAVIPASQAFGSTGSEQLGVGANHSLVLVGDILSLTPTKATGAVKTLPSGFPTVTLASTGQPTITVPKSTAPATLKIADREVGTGATVKSGDTVTVQYQGVLWRNGSVFDQSWGKTGPASFSTAAVVKGFRDALVGQKVGSQVVAIVPPADGYGKTGAANGQIKGTDTLVFVIDILATTHA
ncbi:FKBP-type peptidyl-prolyl cis-trans isomerase [Amnibacterium sp.]|uniref:FKBP-type peptidyl-prolyl cis-trans isomerase n=1 Tax=Amnibacterium sp. TaxID=1872496 RepID=UPI002627427C|nr:FKBP-type peptidyl-prolyl cis-trans isomerase [Amnibacterium sp.]MCU1474776.1 peptidylprolyl isomerase [Amnibacterium sp.]